MAVCKVGPVTGQCGRNSKFPDIFSEKSPISNLRKSVESLFDTWSARKKKYPTEDMQKSFISNSARI
jgi:hypothetical protein